MMSDQTTGMRRARRLGAALGRGASDLARTKRADNAALELRQSRLPAPRASQMKSGPT
jgi:hypothetical protein